MYTPIPASITTPPLTSHKRSRQCQTLTRHCGLNRHNTPSSAPPHNSFKLLSPPSSLLSMINNKKMKMGIRNAIADLGKKNRNDGGSIETHRV